MPKFNVSITPGAHQDMEDIYGHIMEVYLAPATAKRYFNGILDKILSLAANADIFALNPFRYIQLRYGPGARTVAHKKVTIVYTIHGSDVVVRAVIPGSIIH
ncbi:MAG: type II toxin-antitoxin system RelE/ParE family toxin [Prevotellaceae bacterium]|jgi:plasmid stabilization system protein ParE|nr:type II toxin-antitoxin system RelE/ParE family toxin [Prevotellaceae bacterium]